MYASMLLSDAGLGVAEHFAAFRRTRRTVGRVFFDVHARACAVYRAADLDLPFEYVKHLMVGMTMHRDIRIRSPVTNHHLRTRSAGRNMEPLGITEPAFFLLDVFFVPGKNRHKFSRSKTLSLCPLCSLWLMLLCHRRALTEISFALRHPFFIGGDHDHLIFFRVAHDALRVLAALHFADLAQIHLAQLDDAVVDRRPEMFILSIRDRRHAVDHHAVLDEMQRWYLVSQNRIVGLLVFFVGRDEFLRRFPTPAERVA